MSRLTRDATRVLDRLRKGRARSRDLSVISPRFGMCIVELRRQGYAISSSPMNSGAESWYALDEPTAAPARQGAFPELFS